MFFNDTRTVCRAIAKTDNVDSIGKLVSEYWEDRMGLRSGKTAIANICILGDAHAKIFELINDTSTPQNVLIDLIKFVGIAGGVNEGIELGKIFSGKKLSDEISIQILSAIASIGGPTATSFLLEISLRDNDSRKDPVSRNAAYLYDELEVSAESPIKINTVLPFQSASFSDAMHELRQLDFNASREIEELLLNS